MKEKENKKLRKGERGITLIALIITIVILVLITGVAIRGLTGNTGIIDTAQVATDEYKVQQYKEQVAQLRENAIMEYAVMGKDVTIESLAELMNEETIWVKEVHANVNEEETNDDIIVTTTDGYIYQVYYDEKTGEKFVEYAGRGKEENLPKVLATYDKVKAKLHITARDEEGISKIEAIYRGEVEPERSIDAGGEKEKEVELSLEKTGWYIVKITSTRGQYRYAWIKVTSTVIAPTFKVVSNGTEKEGWYGADGVQLKVEISTDNETATGIWYKVTENESTQEEYTKAEGKSVRVKLPQTTGTIKIVANSVDKKGNISEDGTYTLLYDNTDPKIEAKTTKASDGENGWYKSNITITLSDSTDEGSGIVGYYYYYRNSDSTYDTGIQEGKENREYVAGKDIEFPITKDGVRTLVFSVVDLAGNESGEQTFTDLKKDGQAPNAFNASVDENERWPHYFIIRASTTDNLSGDSSRGEGYGLTYTYHVKQGNDEVKIQSTEATDYTANELSVNTNYTVYVEAKDKAGNITTTPVITASTYGELAAPNVDIQGGATGSDSWYTSDEGQIIITDSVDSTRTGVSKFKYKIDSGEEKEYNKDNPPTLQSIGEGTHTITAWGVDANGTVGTKTTPKTIKKDTNDPAAPTFTLKGTTGTIQENKQWYTSDVEVTIKAGTDPTPGSGESQIQYSSTNGTNNGSIDGTQTNTTVTAEGQTTITAYTKDRAGRTSSAGTLNVYIDKTPPTNVTLTVDTANSKGNTIKVNATATENISGIVSYTYEYRESPNGAWQTAGTTTNTSYTYPTTMIALGKTYYLRVYVTNGAGLKAYSDGSNGNTGTGGTQPLPEVKTECVEGQDTWDNGKITKAATCIDKGEKEFTCTVCGKKKTEDIPMKEHTWEVIDEGIRSRLHAQRYEGGAMPCLYEHQIF